MARGEANAQRLLDGAGGGAASVETVRAGLAERLRARRSEIEEAIFARFRDVGFDPAAGEDADYVAGARAAVAEAVDYGLLAIEQGEEWFGSIPPAAVAQARRAARHGVSLERVLLRYNAGHTLLEDFVMQAAETSAFSNQTIALRHVLRTQGALLDHFTSSIAHEYQHEIERAAHSPELRRTEHVQRLLAGAPVDAAELGYEFDAEHLGVIAMGVKAGETVRALADGARSRAVERLAQRGDRVGVVRWSAHSSRSRRSSALLSAKQAPGVSFAIGRAGARDRRMASHAPPGPGRDAGRAAQAAAAHAVCRRGSACGRADGSGAAPGRWSRSIYRRSTATRTARSHARRCARTSPRGATRPRPLPRSGWTGTRSNAACSRSRRGLAVSLRHARPSWK